MSKTIKLIYVLGKSMLKKKDLLKKLNLIIRNSDVVLKQKDLINLYTFKKFPVFVGCTNQEKKLDLLADMNLEYL